MCKPRLHPCPDGRPFFLFVFLVDLWSLQHISVAAGAAHAVTQAKRAAHAMANSPEKKESVFYTDCTFPPLFLEKGITSTYSGDAFMTCTLICRWYNLYGLYTSYNNTFFKNKIFFKMIFTLCCVYIVCLFCLLLFIFGPTESAGVSFRNLFWQKRIHCLLFSLLLLLFISDNIAIYGLDRLWESTWNWRLNAWWKMTVADKEKYATNECFMFHIVCPTNFWFFM